MDHRLPKYDLEYTTTPKECIKNGRYWLLLGDLQLYVKWIGNSVGKQRLSTFKKPNA